MPASNVAPLCSCISKEALDEKGQAVPQLVFYQAGVGTSWMQCLGGRITGRGITSNIEMRIRLLVTTTKRETRFSCLASPEAVSPFELYQTLLRTIGILNASGLAHFFSISQDCKHQNEDSWRLTKTPWGSATDPRPSPRTATGQANAYVKQLKDLDFLRYDKAPIGVKACGVWDTVGYIASPFE